MNNVTMQTYAQIADTFFEANNQPDRQQREIGRFLNLLPDNALILDVGSGPGYDAATFRQHNHRAIATDLSIEMMQTGRKQFDGAYVQADMRHLPFGQVFDALWVCASLLHLSKADARVALDEFTRLLKPSGLLYLAVKEGDGEEMTKEAYGHPLGRYFCYWHSAELDTQLAQHFTIIDGWRTISHNKQSWLARFATKTA